MRAKLLGETTLQADHRLVAHLVFVRQQAVSLAQFFLRQALHADIEGMSRLDDSPNQHLGSAYDGGWYVYANKDLRTILRPKHVRGRFSRIYCGQGRIGRCRSALLNSLASVLNTNPYGENAGCGVGDDQMCYDAIHYRSTGGITQPDMEWQNRPTFQQTVEIPQAVP